jgi:hypothetical protein
MGKTELVCTNVRISDSEGSKTTILSMQSSRVSGSRAGMVADQDIHSWQVM